jgi:hypothetical protein
MSTSSSGATTLRFVLLAVLASGGCSDDSGGGPAQVQAPGGPGPAGPAAKSNPAIKEIMGKVARGPQSLTSVIGKELEADPPPWDTIDPQAKELAKLTVALGPLEPPKGSQESWAKHTATYASQATKLVEAVEAKDVDAARDSHSTLSRSCMGCHREHRATGPGMGKGGFGPKGARKGGFRGGPSTGSTEGPPGAPPVPTEGQPDADSR